MSPSSLFLIKFLICLAISFVVIADNVSMSGMATDDLKLF